MFEDVSFSDNSNKQILNKQVANNPQNAVPDMHTRVYVCTYVQEQIKDLVNQRNKSSEEVHSVYPARLATKAHNRGLFVV